MLRLTVAFLVVSNIILPITLAQKNIQILIMHTNNIKASFENSDKYAQGRSIGGCARISTLVGQARSASNQGKGPPILYLDAGDVHSGNLWLVAHRHKVAVDIMNVLNPDAMCAGNSDFSYGIIPFLEKVKFPVVISNLKFTDSNLNKLINRSLIITLEDVKVGIIGYLSTDVKYLPHVNARVTDEVVAVNSISKDLVKQGVKIIIALGHSDYRIDKRIAKLVRDVDLVIGGHSKVFQWNGKQPDSDKPKDLYPKVVTQRYGKIVPVVNGFGYAKYLGKLLLTFDKNGSLINFSGQPIFLDASVSEDATIIDILNKYRPAIEILNRTKVGQSKVFLDAATCRSGECNFGNLVTDSFINYQASRYKGVTWTDAAVAMMNSGAIRRDINASLRENEVYQSDILTALPFQQPMCITEMRGIDLVKTLEGAARRIVLLTSGLRIVYTCSKPISHRIQSMRVRCASCEVPKYLPIQNGTWYKIVINKYLADGGDGHAIIKEKGKACVPLNATDSDAVFEYFKMMGVVMPEVDDRVLVEENVHSKMKMLTPQNTFSTFLLVSIVIFL